MKLGFTGTSKGMTGLQTDEIYRLMIGGLELHHGDCVGADAEAHQLALFQKMPVILHPPIRNDKRAFCKGAVSEREPKKYLVRNREIVDETDALLAAPSGPETLRSGTWSTIRYALKRGKPVSIVMPDGKFG